MINEKMVLVIIPARGGSKGLPGKNTKMLCGKPLLGWPIQAAKKSKYVDKIIVSTDDEKIKKVALHQGAEVPFLRPKDLANDESKSADVIEHAINFLQESNNFDYIILLEPTSPLTETIDIDQALEILDSKRNIADCIVGVSKVENTHPLFDVVINSENLIVPYIQSGFGSATRRQDLDELYFFEGSLYISDVKVFLNKKTFYHDRTLSYIVPKWKSFEIDHMVDFICVEAIMKNIQLLR